MAPPDYPKGRSLLEGKKVVVTAAAGTGIGFATAKRCLEEGASVLISDHHAVRLEQAVAQLAELGEVVSAVCDVTDEQHVQALVAAAEASLGAVDVWVNNAGLGGQAPLIEMSDEAWQRVLDVSLTGTFRCVRAAMRHMKPNEQGVIINNASVLGWRAQKHQAHYRGESRRHGADPLRSARSRRVWCAHQRQAPSLASASFLSKVMDQGEPDALQPKTFGPRRSGRSPTSSSF